MLHSILATGEAATFWLPKQSSTQAPGVDDVYYLVYWVNVIFTVLILAMVVWFTFKYRHREGHTVESSAGHSTALELTWTFVPTVIVVFIFYFGFKGYLALAVEPPNAYEITANGKMWNWSFIYPNGYVSPELHIPANTPVRIVLTSDDVLHSLFIPDCRVKKDVVPGRYNRLWVDATMEDPNAKEEIHDIYCAEYCGTNHSQMLSKCIVHPKAQFGAWLADASEFTDKGIKWVDAGHTIYKQRGCAQCHSIDGSIITGPSWKDMFGSQVATSAGTVTADEAYIRESVLYPQAKIHQGFQPVMPSYLGSMKENDINALIYFMKSISSHYTGDKALLDAEAKKTTEGSKPAK